MGAGVNDRDDQRIFWAMKFSISGFFWLENLGKYFFGQPQGFFWVLIFAPHRSSLSLENRSTPWACTQPSSSLLLIALPNADRQNVKPVLQQNADSGEWPEVVSGWGKARPLFLQPPTPLCFFLLTFLCASIPVIQSERLEEAGKM